MKKIVSGIFVLLSISSHAGGIFEPVDSGFTKETIQFLANINDSMVIKSIEESQYPAFFMLINKTVDRLLSSSHLSYAQGDLPRLKINYSNYPGFATPEMEAGVLTVYPANFMMFETEDQVAAVIAHELVHHYRAHDQNLVGIEFDFWPFKEMRQSYRREEHELEADLLSLSLLKNAGYYTGAPIEVLGILDNLFRQLPPAITPPDYHSKINMRITRFKKKLEGGVSEDRNPNLLDDSVIREFQLLREKNL